MTRWQRLTAYMRRLVTTWCVVDPEPRYSALDQLDGRAMTPTVQQLEAAPDGSRMEYHYRPHLAQTLFGPLATDTLVRVKRTIAGHAMWRMTGELRDIVDSVGSQAALGPLADVAESVRLLPPPAPVDDLVRPDDRPSSGSSGDRLAQNRVGADAVIRDYLAEFLGDLPGIVCAAVVALALPMVVFAALLKWVPLP